MRRCISGLAACCLIIAAAYNFLPADAAQGPATERISRANAEVVVFETAKCPYCSIFRRDVAGDYQQSRRAGDIPIRFIDIRRVDISGMRLSAPLTMLPTVVLMQNGREVDRITGYMGREPFFHMISRLTK